MIIPEGYAQITHVFSGSPLPSGAVITYGLLNADDSSADGLAEAAHIVFRDNVLPQLSENVFLASTLCKKGPNDTGAQAEFVGPENGAVADNDASPASAALVRKNTAVGGRVNRGRFYLPGLGDSAIGLGGGLDATYRANLQAGLDDMYAAYDAGNHDMYLLHDDLRDPETGEPIPGTAHVPTLITSLTVDAFIATQRRRLRR